MAKSLVTDKEEYTAKLGKYLDRSNPVNIPKRTCCPEVKNMYVDPNLVLYPNGTLYWII